MVPEPGRGRRPFLARRLADEPELRRRIEAADRLGIPPSRFEGREPAETTEYEYDGGLLVRSVTIREPEWTDQDRTEVLALAVYRASLCPGGCGQPVQESTAHYSTGPSYEAKSTTCRACAELGESKRGKAERNADTGALLWHVVKSKG